MATSSRPGSAANTPAKFNDSLALLSPVIGNQPKNGARITGLRDPLYNQATVCFANPGSQSESFVKIFLPAMTSSPFVQQCITAVCSVVTKDLAIQLQSKWYSMRNAPGPTSVSPRGEWKDFTQCLLSKE